MPSGPAGDTTDFWEAPVLEDAVIPGTIWMASMTDPIKQYIKTRAKLEREDSLISFLQCIP
jgi:hypothetical protein